jgi:hypothetical protein
VRLYFREGAAFAKPEVYLYLEEHSLAELAVSREVFAAVLGWITRLCLSPG